MHLIEYFHCIHAQFEDRSRLLGCQNHDSGYLRNIYICQQFILIMVYALLAMPKPASQPPTGS